MKIKNLGFRIISGILSAAGFYLTYVCAKDLVINYFPKQTFLLTGWEQVLYGLEWMGVVWGFIGGLFFGYCAVSKD